ncbi:MAG: PhoH family protein [Cytophagales bacterium]|nr:MAG: PhoH family protein [Cytophagales bacterium]TAF60935.1 MAG: PhoH family protein [Cytophagales bacterium]
MVEKIIQLENVALPDFFGAEDANLREIRLAFPESRILARGNEIRIQGSSPEIVKINEIINQLLEHYHQFGKVDVADVRLCLNDDSASLLRKDKDDTIIFGVKGLPIKAKTTNQQALVKASNEKDIVFALGPAGTGKTYVAVALAVRALKNKLVRKIVITRPAVEAGESLGFLPGDMREKIDPYLRPIYDAFEEMIPSEKLNHYLEENIIEIAPIAFMRGRTLSNAFILLDEAQNTTSMQMKMCLTRMGQNSKMIITGDVSQIDLPSKQRSGLVDAVHILKKIKDIGFVYLDGKDVVRHYLVRQVIEAYERNTEEEQNHKEHHQKPRSREENQND